MSDLERVVDRVRAVFEDIETRVLGDGPVVVRKLRVEVVAAAMAGDTPTLVLITPWTLNGLAFPPDGSLPRTLVVAGTPRAVVANAIEGIGPYRSVTLVPDVSHLPSQAHARKTARLVGAEFREAVARARGRGAASITRGGPRPDRDPSAPPGEDGGGDR